MATMDVRGQHVDSRGIFVALERRYPQVDAELGTGPLAMPSIEQLAIEDASWFQLAVLPNRRAQGVELVRAHWRKQERERMDVHPPILCRCSEQSDGLDATRASAHGDALTHVRAVLRVLLARSQQRPVAWPQPSMTPQPGAQRERHDASRFAA